MQNSDKLNNRDFSRNRVCTRLFWAKIASNAKRLNLFSYILCNKFWHWNIICLQHFLEPLNFHFKVSCFCSPALHTPALPGSSPISSLLCTSETRYCSGPSAF